MQVLLSTLEQIERSGPALEEHVQLLTTGTLFWFDSLKVKCDKR